MNWEVPDDCHIGGTPWFLRDGDTIVFKDERDIDPEVLAALAAVGELHEPGVESPQSKKAAARARPVERGIHISVISREEQEQIMAAIEAENKKKKEEQERKAAEAAVAAVAASIAAQPPQVPAAVSAPVTTTPVDSDKAIERPT